MGITIVVIIFDSLYNIKNVLFIKLFFQMIVQTFQQILPAPLQVQAFQSVTPPTKTVYGLFQLQQEKT